MATNVQRFLRCLLALLSLALGVAAASAQTAAQADPPAQADQPDQADQFTPEFRQVHQHYDVKHTPKIVAPNTVRRGAWFNVTVSVGAGSQHPSLSEHFVRYIALYKDAIEIARVYLHPVYSSPSVTFTVALDEGGSLRAVAEPTHSAAWEATKAIAVTP